MGRYCENRKGGRRESTSTAPVSEKVVERKMDEKSSEIAVNCFCQTKIDKIGAEYLYHTGIEKMDRRS
jgi:hypothetical protein